MAAAKFNLIFEGQVEPGHDPDKVLATLESLFELEVGKSGGFFSGQLIVLGESMDAKTAESFGQALAGIGVTTRLEAANQSPGLDLEPDKRSVQRRVCATRRALYRPGAIQPDRRKKSAQRRQKPQSH